MMSRMIPFVALLVLLGQAPEASAQDDARALVAKAIQAAGGEDKLSQVAAVHLRLKGILTEVDSAPFTGEVQRQGTDRLRYALRADVSGEVLTMITVVNGANVWIKVNEQEEIVTEATRKALERSGHADQVARLLPLIRDPRFNLTSLGESTREGRPVLGVKVEGKGEPEVRLFFDKANGLLFRVEYRGVDDESGKEFDAAVVHEEYRELGATAAEEATLQAAKVENKDDALLDYVRKRTLTPAAKERMAGLVRRLGSEDFTEREAASKDLIAAGGAAVPFLRQAAKSGDVEIARRAQACLDRMKGDTDAEVTSAVLRLLGQKKPAGAAEALKELLASAADDALAREVRFALAALGKEDGKSDEQAGRRIFIPGLKIAMKITEYRDGKKSAEWQRLQVWFYNKFDESVFAKP